MWDSIVAASLVLGVVIVAYGVINYFTRKKNLKAAQKYYEELQQQLGVGVKVILMSGIIGVIEQIEGSTIILNSGGTNITCIKESIQKVVV